EAEPDPQVLLVRRVRWLQQHLARHTEVADDRGAVVERQPEVLATAADPGDGTAGERPDEVRRAGQGAAHGTEGGHLDRFGLPAGDPALQALPDGLDLG